MDKAWGAWSAALLHDRTLEKELIEQLHWAESFRAADAYNGPYAATQALLDALIQIGAAVPSQAILPLASRWRAEMLILLASPASDLDEAALLAMGEEKLHDAEWVAVNNLLLRWRSTALLGRMLPEICITHAFDVSDSGSTRAGLPAGERLGSGVPEVGFPQGFPSIGIYQLEAGRFESYSPGPGHFPLIRGPMHLGDVFYRRLIIPAGGTARGPGPHFDADRQLWRQAYVADLAGLSLEETQAPVLPKHGHTLAVL